jgi:4-amino-4-deoxy-L-arabinose transferase-like glycosyltransferase
MRNTHTPIPPTKNQTTSNHQLRRLEVGFWLLAILLGLFHAWADRHYLFNADAMSYLDIAEAYLRRDWDTAVNAYWSPLYSWLLALALLVIKPSPYWKFTVLHFVNFAIYLFAFGCFSFLIREVVRAHRIERAEMGFVTVPDRALVALAYSLVIWSNLFLITVALESPDMLVAAFVYLATGLLVRIRRAPFRWTTFIVLGVVLGAGFLAKSVMLPLTVIFLLGCIFAIGNLRRALPRVALAGALFVLVAGPFVFAISQAKGSLTTGKTGKLNYLWSINRVINTHWQGEEPGSGTPAHATRKIFDDPPAFEFAEPVGGTYPVWYDPTYWYEGSVSHFDLRGQLKVIGRGIGSYYDIVQEWGLQYGLAVALIFFYLLSRRGRRLIHDLKDQWPLLLPAIGGFGLYVLVNVQDRYVASFIVLFWLGLFAAVRLPQTPDSERFMKAAMVVLAGLIVLTSIASSARETGVTLRDLVRGEDPVAHEQWQVAEGLRERGLAPSDKVAFIGYSVRGFWAHLSQLRIVAEVRRDKITDFWKADDDRKAQLINAFAGTGVKAVVAERPPAGTDLSNWQRIRQTDYYVHLF